MDSLSCSVFAVNIKSFIDEVIDNIFLVFRLPIQVNWMVVFIWFEIIGGYIKCKNFFEVFCVIKKCGPIIFYKNFARYICFGIYKQEIVDFLCVELFVAHVRVFKFFRGI